MYSHLVLVRSPSRKASLKTPPSYKGLKLSGLKGANCGVLSVQTETDPSAISALKPGACSGVMLPFDKLSAPSSSVEAALLTPSQRPGVGAVEVSIKETALDRLLEK